MRHLKLLGFALMALFAVVGVAASAASAETLPDISISLGGAYPLHLNFADNGVTPSFLENTSGGVISGKGLLVLLLQSELSALGFFEALFLNVRFGSETCHSEGDSEGEVLTHGEYHVVLSPGGRLELLLLLELVLIPCGTIKIHVQGNLLVELENTGTETTELTEVGVSVLGNGKGKPLIKEYKNDAGGISYTTLLSNLGTGFLESAENVGELITLKVLESKMFVISPR